MEILCCADGLLKNKASSVNDQRSSPWRRRQRTDAGSRPRKRVLHSKGERGRVDGDGAYLESHGLSLHIATLDATATVMAPTTAAQMAAPALGDDPSASPSEKSGCSYRPTAARMSDWWRIGFDVR